MTSSVTRRSFLETSSAVGLGYFFTGPAISVAKAVGANDKLRVAGIGVGGKGSGDIDQAGSLMEVVALCDIDEDKLAPKAKKWPEAKTYFDFRKLYDESGKNFDAIVVSTPDHTHALAAAIGIKLGKHAYVQKPLTRTVYEAHLLRKLAKENKVCTQMGNQGTSENGLRRAVELVQGGAIGPVKEVHVWTNRPIWPQAPGVTDQKPPMPTDCPKTVHWDEFLGGAPERPYAKGIHPFAWRGYWDFGTGAIGDMACHTANTAFMALKLGHPEHASAEATDVNPLTCPSSAHVVLKFPARGDLPPVTLHWYEGKKNNQKLVPPTELVERAMKVAGTQKLSDSGSILVGEKGIAYSPNDYGAQFFFETGEKTGGNTKPEKLPINGGGDGGQKKEWVEAIKAGKPEVALSNFEYGSFLTAAFLLGNVAIRTGKPFAFDGETLTAKDVPEAAALIKQATRKGWELPS